MDVKSHQTDTEIPQPVIVQGNEQADQGCEDAKLFPLPPDVLMPTGGFFAFLSRASRTITRDARSAIRDVLREEAVSEWGRRSVQGKLASIRRAVFTKCLELRWYTQIVVPQTWAAFKLPSDHSTVDLSKALYRCTRAIGGSWTEMQHSDPNMAEKAQRWAARFVANPAVNHRTCPLCREGPGTV